MNAETKERPFVVPKPRRSRVKCHGEKGGEGHTCSEDHIRVPAHCRIKRNRKRPEIRGLQGVPVENAT